MLPLILIAPPQAGKGTLAKMIVDKYNIPHISTGELLRYEMEIGSDIGKLITKKMNDGILIEDNIVTKLLKERILKEDCKQGFILDGYPRNILQVDIYLNLMKEINRDPGVVINLFVDFEILLNRVKGRLVCKDCGASFNILSDNSIPKIDGICDRCEGSLKKRSDDNEKVFKDRFDLYEEKTQPIIEYFKSKDIKVMELNSENKDIVFKEVENIISGNEI